MNTLEIQKYEEQIAVLTAKVRHLAVVGCRPSAGVRNLANCGRSQQIRRRA